MKRIIPAVISFVIIICAIIGSNFYIKNECRGISEEIEKCYTAFSKGDNESALSISKKINDNWHKQHKALSMFVYHSFLDDLTIYIEEIPLYAELGIEDKFFAACKKADTVLEQIVHESKFKISCFY